MNSHQQPRRSRRAQGAASVLVAVIFASLGGAGLTAPAQATAVDVPPLREGRPAWVNVSVATVWRTPESARAVDRPALAKPARIVEWLSTMTTEERRGLWHKADTQALLGDRVRVVDLRPGWARVVIPSQPSQLDPRGYPGWVPRRQLTAAAPARSERIATVTNRTAWLRVDHRGGRKLLQISYGTRLPVVQRLPRFVRVLTPTGTVRRIAGEAVSVHGRGEPAIEPSRDSIVDTAMSFRGLPYLWAGLSGFGLDCSGLTWLTYRVHGILTPRDALPQSEAGTPVSTLRRGDLMFFATDGLVHHVSMYVGNGQMVHAPGTGQTVQVVSTSTPAYAREYSGARRYYR